MDEMEAKDVTKRVLTFSNRKLTNNIYETKQLYTHGSVYENNFGTFFNVCYERQCMYNSNYNKS